MKAITGKVTVMKGGDFGGDMAMIQGQNTQRLIV